MRCRPFRRPSESERTIPRMPVSDSTEGKKQRENRTMPIDQLTQHPALKPTVLAQDVLENVYRPTPQDGEKAQSPAVSQSLSRERNRAA